LTAAGPLGGDGLAVQRPGRNFVVHRTHGVEQRERVVPVASTMPSANEKYAFTRSAGAGKFDSHVIFGMESGSTLPTDLGGRGDAGDDDVLDLLDRVQDPVLRLRDGGGVLVHVVLPVSRPAFPVRWGGHLR
jgi:hypothetical protein